VDIVASVKVTEPSVCPFDLPEESVPSLPPPSVNVEQKDGYAVAEAVTGYCISRVETSEGEIRGPFSRVYLPPGEYKLYVCSQEACYEEPVEVRVERAEVGSVVVRYGDKVATVKLYSDGSYEKSEETVPPSEQVDKPVVECNNAKCSVLVADFLGYSYTVPYKPSAPSHVAKYVKLSVSWTVPELGGGSVLGTSTKTATLEFEYSGEHDIAVDGLLLSVKPAECAFAGDCTLKLKFSSPLGSAEKEIPISWNSEFDLLQVYDFEQSGLLYEIEAMLVGGGRLYLDKKLLVQLPDDVAPGKYGITADGDKVESRYFPLRCRCGWRFLEASEERDTVSASCVVKPEVPEELAGLVEEEWAEVDVISPEGSKTVYEYVRRPLAHTTAVLEDSDGQKIEVDKLGSETPLWATYTSKIRVDTDGWIEIATELLDFVVVATPSVEHASIIEVAGKRYVLVPVDDWIELMDAEGGKPFKLRFRFPVSEDGSRRKVETTAVSPLKGFSAVLTKDSLKVSGALLSKGTVKVLLEADSWEESKEFAVGGIKEEWSGEVKLSKPFEQMRVKVQYSLNTEYGATVELFDGYVPIATDVGCVSSDGEVATVRSDCIASAIQTKVVEREPVWKVQLHLPDSLPEWISAKVGDSELVPGGSVEVDPVCIGKSEAVVEVSILGSKHRLKVRPPESLVALSSDPVVKVLQFGRLQKIDAVLDPVQCYAGDCSRSVKATLTPNKPKLTLKEALALFGSSGTAPKKFLVKALGRSAVVSAGAVVEKKDGKYMLNYGGYEGELVVRCSSGEMSVDEAINSGLACPLYAVFRVGETEFSIPVGTPQLTVTVEGETAIVQSRPEYFGTWDVVLELVKEDLSRDVRKLEELSEESVRVELPKGVVSVTARAYKNDKLVTAYTAVVYGVFDAKFSQAGSMVKVVIVGSFPEKQRVELVAVGVTGNKYLLWSESWSGAEAYDITVDLTKVLDVVTKVCAVAGDRMVCYDVEDYMSEVIKKAGGTVGELSGLGILGKLFRLLG
jgi:hypothetical protein